MLYNRNRHNLINQLYSNEKIKIKKKAPVILDIVYLTVPLALCWPESYTADEREAQESRRFLFLFICSVTLGKAVF